MIYTIKTTSGREDIVADIISSKIKSQALDIKAILHPTELKGYVFIEGDVGDIHKAVQGMLHVKGLMDKPVNLEEIQRFLEVKKVVVGIGDEVEIIGGGFKGEKGVISRVDKTKEEVTVELREGSIPIPVTVPNELVKVVKKATKKKEGEEEEPKEKPKKISLDDLKGSLGGGEEPEPETEEKEPATEEPTKEEAQPKTSREGAKSEETTSESPEESTKEESETKTGEKDKKGEDSN